MEFRAGRRSRGPVINVTSLIDVLFLLVIFVLVSARFEPESGIAVNLPKGHAEGKKAPVEYTLTITHDGTLFLEEETVTLETLAQQVAATRKTMDDPVLEIRADKGVQWDTVAQAASIALEAGQTKVRFPTIR